MGTTQPIRTNDEIQDLKEYFLNKGETRNYVLVTMGLNTALRISDLLELTWKDVWNFSRNCFRQHIMLTEHKTKKNQAVYLNMACIDALKHYKDEISDEVDHWLPSRINEYCHENNITTNRVEGFFFGSLKTLLVPLLFLVRAIYICSERMILNSTCEEFRPNTQADYSSKRP